MHGIDPIVKDYWGKEHNLVEENIKVLFTESQFKLAKYYDDWDHYKRCFKECGCHLCATNYEEAYIPDTYLNYQMIQTLTDFTDYEIDMFVSPTKAKINAISDNKDTMLRTLNADPTSDQPYQQALFYYPELLREAFARNTLKDIKRRWVLDAKSGKIKCQNKRLFAIPDMYAACEHWFLGVEKPQGLLKDGEIACKVYEKYDKADVLRSPHLYMEHAIRSITHDPAIYDWFYTKGIYTSCHDLISRILQFDVDGDQLNVVVDPIIVNVAERNIEKHNVVPLFYDANKAAAETLSRETMFGGLKRAHEYSGIGQVSNALTKLWNRDEPDRFAAAMLCYYNNQVIDAAKTGKINGYNKYPSILSRINKATGGPAGKMPHFFQFSKNGRRFLDRKREDKKTYCEPNNSTMNRICSLFDDVKPISSRIPGVPPFNWQMLLSKDHIKIKQTQEKTNQIISTFCALNASNKNNAIMSSYIADLTGKTELLGENILKENIAHWMMIVFGNLEDTYPVIVKHLFTGTNHNKSIYKQAFWNVYGEIALRTLKDN